MKKNMDKDKKTMKEHMDVKQDEDLIKKEVKKSALKKRMDK